MSEHGARYQSFGTLSPVVGYVECRLLYGKRRLVIPWQPAKGPTCEVYLDVAGVDALCRQAMKNRGHSARRGPVSVRRMNRHGGATGLRKGGSRP